VKLFVALAGSLKRQHASKAAGFAAVAIVAAAFIGWWARLPLLSSWGWGFAHTKPVTVLCLAALGLALVHPGKNARFAFAVGLVVAAVATLDLFDFGIDRWLAPWAAVPQYGAASFPMPHATALALVLAGGSLALSRFERHRLAATVLAGIAGAIAVLALLGYLTGIVTLNGSASVNSPALPTVVGLLCVASGIILRIGTIPALRKPRPLWHLLVTLGGAIIAPLLLFGAYAGIRIADAQLNEVRQDLMSEARTLSADVDREIIGEIETLQALAASPSLRQGDFAEFQRQAEAALALRQSGDIMLIDRNMQQLVNTWVSFGTRLPKADVPEPVERALATGKPQITGLFMGAVTKQLMFGIILPVQIDGENRYALVRSPGQHALSRVVAANELPPGWQAVVSEAAHRIIARSEPEEAFVGKELPPSQWLGAGSGGVFEFIDSEGRPSLQAYEWSALTGWQTAVWAPKALLEAPVRALWWTLGVMALLAFALVVALALWLGRIIARSVGQAARAAIASGEGGPLLPSGTPIVEVNTLMAELGETAARRQAAEEKERLLMREVNHRAKNMLSVVDAIAHQTAAKNPEDFVERFSERIQALSANQDVLVRNAWQGVDIEALVRAQLAHFADLIGSRIAVHGPKLRLSAASAQAIGLALHELATNAGKYGALSMARGRVSICWGTVGDTFTMNWTEHDGPPVSPPKRCGFGTTVMKRMAERSVDGAVDLDYAPSGVTWRLTCPAASALEPREREPNFR
jgi:two-component sensor histidine kinase